MKKWIAISLFALLTAMARADAGAGEGNKAGEETMKIRMLFNREEVLVSLRDTPASRDFFDPAAP